jgi:hypothetical protein
MARALISMPKQTAFWLCFLVAASMFAFGIMAVVLSD